MVDARSDSEREADRTRSELSARLAAQAAASAIPEACDAAILAVYQHVARHANRLTDEQRLAIDEQVIMPLRGLARDIREEPAAATLSGLVGAKE